MDDAPAVPAQRKGPDVVQVGDRFNDPWVRAMMLSPSAHGFLRTTLYGPQDFRTLGAMFAKPSSVVIVKFAADPTNGLSTDEVQRRRGRLHADRQLHPAHRLAAVNLSDTGAQTT